MALGTGIEAAQVIPGILEQAAVDDLAALIAPRPLLRCSASEDEYSSDAGRIAGVAARAYADTSAPNALHHSRVPGGHALTEERFESIVALDGRADLGPRTRRSP